jgi:hypothetical protein
VGGILQDNGPEHRKDCLAKAKDQLRGGRIKNTSQIIGC